MKAMKTVKGYQYCVTANTETTITDDYGLNLTCPAGQQTYFVANGDEVTVEGDGVVTQTRGGIITGGSGGGGEKINPGELVIGGTQGPMTIQDVNTAKRLWPGTFGSLTELPEGVTFAGLESAVAPPMASTGSLAVIFQQIMTYGRTTAIGAVSTMTLFGGSALLRLPSSTNFASLKDGTYMFTSALNLESFASDMPSLTRGVNMFSGSQKLTSFKGHAPLLTATTAMFSGCSKLAHWEGSFGALTNASNMFNGCVLDLVSVQNLANALPSVSGVGITIGVDSAKVSQAQQDAANTIIVGKGWVTSWQRN